MDVTVRYWSYSGKEIVVHFLSASFFNHATAVDVARALLDTLNQPDYKFDLGKLLSLSSVGQNVNKAVWKIIYENLKVEDLHGLFPFIPCSLLVAHNTFCYVLYEYGNEVDQLCLDLFYWFKQSPSRWKDKNTITKFKFVASLPNIFEPFLNYSRPTATLFIFSMINAVPWLRGSLVDI